MTWTEDAIEEFEAGIHPPAQCPTGGCAQCYSPTPTIGTLYARAALGDEDAMQMLEAWGEREEWIGR